MLLRLAGFTGMWPVRDPRALPDNAAIYAENIRVEGGAYLKGARNHTLRVNPVGLFARKAYPIRTAGGVIWSNAYWMLFPDPNTMVQKAPIVNDIYERYYWASFSSNGLRFATKNDIVSGAWLSSGGYQSGMVAPVIGSMTIIPVAGTGTTTGPKTTRAYLVTHVNIYGEESPPSPPAEATGFVDQEWRVQSISQPVAGAGLAPINIIRIYRTVTDVTGFTDYYKVDDVPAGTTVYIDRFSDLKVSGNNKLGSTNYTKPPPLVGLVSLPNGIFVGWGSATPRDVYISENYRPHAWPESYKVTVDHPIVGMGVFGNSVVICTEGEPAIISGTQAKGMSLTKTGAMLPCLSRLSIANAPEGVYYVSEEGLVLVGPSGINIVTRGLISPEQWRLQFKPELTTAMYTDGEYVGLILDGLQVGYKFNPNNPSEHGLTYFNNNPTADNPAIAPIPTWTIDVEPWTGKPFLIGIPPGFDIQNVAIYEWESPNATAQPWVWQSKEIQLPYPCNFSVAQFYFDDTPGASLTCKIYARIRGADGTVSRQEIYNQVIPYSGKEFRLPSGFKSDVWEVKLSGNVEVQSFVMAGSPTELRSV